MTYWARKERSQWRALKGKEMNYEPLAMKWTSWEEAWLIIPSLLMPSTQWLLPRVVGKRETKCESRRKESWLPVVWRMVVVKDDDQGRERVKVLQSRLGQSISGSEQCLSTAFTGKLFYCFCWVSNFMYKLKRGHFLWIFFFFPQEKFPILCLVKLDSCFSLQTGLTLSDLHQCKCRRVLGKKQHSARYYRRPLCATWDIQINGHNPDMVFWKQRQSTQEGSWGVC